MTQMEKIKLLGMIKEIDSDDLLVEDFMLPKCHYKTEDVIVFVTDQLQKRLQAKEKNKVIDKLIISLNCFVSFWQYGGISISNELVQKIASLEPLIQEWKETYSFDDFISEKIESIFNVTANSLNSTPNQEAKIEDEELIALKENIAKLNSEIELLKKEQNSKESFIKKQTQKIGKANQINVNLTTEVQRLNNEKNLYQKRIQELQAKIEEQIQSCLSKESEFNYLHYQVKQLQIEYFTLKENYTKLQNEMDKVTAENEAMAKDYQNIVALKEQLKAQQELIAQLRKKNNDLTSQNSFYHKENEKQKQEAIVMEKIKEYCLNHYKSISLNELFLWLKNEVEIEGMEESKLYDLFTKVMRQLNITEQEISDKFAITSVKPPKYQTLTINNLNYNQGYKILAIADTHIKDSKHYKMFQPIFANLNEYCQKNGISSVMVLGDVLEGIHVTENQISYSNFNRINSILSLLEKELKDNPINYLFLGGNHDLPLCRLGIDPLKELSLQLKNAYYLGYQEATLCLGTDQNKFYLYHPFQRIDSKSSLMNQLTSLSKLEPTDAYIHLYGNFHQSIFDPIHNICFVPSLWKDRICNGAWEIDVYFNEEQKIDYLILKHLILQEQQLRLVNEIPFKRSLNIKY